MVRRLYIVRYILSPGVHFGCRRRIDTRAAVPERLVDPSATGRIGKGYGGFLDVYRTGTNETCGDEPSRGRSVPARLLPVFHDPIVDLCLHEGDERLQLVQIGAEAEGRRDAGRPIQCAHVFEKRVRSAHAVFSDVEPARESVHAIALHTALTIVARRRYRQLVQRDVPHE